MIKVDNARIFTIFKVLVFVGAFNITQSLTCATIISLFFISTYGYLIAFINGYEVMSVQDNLCLYDWEKAVGNVSCKNFMIFLSF